MKKTKRQRIAATQSASNVAKQRTKATTVLQHHEQFGGNYCSASAHEFVAKLHARISPREFPLQQNPRSEHGGWTFPQHWEKYGFTQKGNNPPTADAAMKILQDETDADRYPLVVLWEVVPGIAGQPGLEGWHVVIAFKEGREICLINPRDKKFLTTTSAGTKAEIHKTIDSNMRQPDAFVDILTYS